MIQDLPAEVLQQIVSHLPSASAIVNLSLVNHKLHGQLSADDFAVLRQFVQRSFPSIKTPPSWREAAVALTSRSRAWHRRGLVARECRPPRDDTFMPGRVQTTQKFGYTPVIDSYETWPGNSVRDRKEVLAWGAAGRLRTRVIRNGATIWSSLRFPDDHLPELDILDVKLLRPHQHSSREGETIILRRANREIVKVETRGEQDTFVQTAKYFVDSQYVEGMDINQSSDPLLALCNTKSIHLFPVHADSDEVTPAATLILEQTSTLRHRTRCFKFLSPNKLAVGIQFLEGRDRAPIHIYDINATRNPGRVVSAVASLTPSHQLLSGRHGATAIAPLDDICGNSGQMFLSGWTDGIVRLHDTRTSADAVAEYSDVVDDGQILSLLPIGHERFLAGSHQNACLKTFDMRMPGARAYSYLNSRPRDTPKLFSGKASAPTSTSTPRNSFTQTQRDINIFLALSVNYSGRLWQPLPSQNNIRLPRYRGSVYSLSAPSSMSPTVYAGIENHVIQLDFISSDDAQGRHPSLVDPILGLQEAKDEDILYLSCYERPREGRESTDAVLLRKQIHWAAMKARMKGDGGEDIPGAQGEAEEGWDERWRLSKYDRPGNGERTPNWRRRGGG